MALPLIQTSLNAGEISPELYGHVDFQKYPAALATCRNCLIAYKGGALSRGGTALVGVCKQAASGTGQVLSIAVNTPGQSYSPSPTVTLLGGGGSGATASATVGGTGGQVVSVTPTNSGSGYTNATVSFGSGAAAATAIISQGQVGAITAVNVTAGGSGYTQTTTYVSAVDPNGNGTGASLAAVINGGVITGITVGAGGSNYDSNTQIYIISFAGINQPAPGSGATATPVLGGGTITGFTITNPGSGYTAPPSVSISGDGTGATAVCAISGYGITGISVVLPGSGYVSPPTVVISDTTGVGAAATATVSPLAGGPPRPIPFQFNITQGYILEFGSNYLRFVFQGGYVLESGIAITGITQANPAVVSVSGEPYNNGDWVFISGVGGMTQVNGETFIVAGTASGHFSLTDLQGNNVNSGAYGAYTSGGTVSRLYTISTPYAGADLPYLKFSQSADVMTLTCSNPITLSEYPIYDLTRLAAADWTLVQRSFADVIAPPATCSASSSGIVANSTNATFSYAVTAVDANGNESIASPIASCHGSDIEVQGGSNSVTWALVSGAKYYNVYRAPAGVDGGGVANPPPPGSIMGFVGSSYGTQFSDTSTTIDLTKTIPTHQNPFARGQILVVNVTGAGSGMKTATYVITTNAGSGFTGTPLVLSGALGGFLITNGGSGYQPGDSIAINGSGFASGSIVFASNPSNADTITLNGVVWTFVTSGATGNQTNIAGSLADTLTGLVASLSTSSIAGLIVASYSISTDQEDLVVTYNTAGVGGNAYTLAASAATPSGGTLTGGAGAGSAGVAAGGSLTFSGNPSNGLTIVLDGVTWTFETTGATGNQTNIQGSLAATLTQLASDLNASANATIALAGYTATATILQIIYKTVGTIGNAYTLNGGTSGATPSAGTLANGVNGSSTPAAALVIGPNSGTYPGVSAWFQQRQFFADSLNNPDTVWATQTGLYKNMDTAIPTEATDAITASPWTEQVNGIQWLVAMPGGLIAMTGGRAWQIIGVGSQYLSLQPITPSTIEAQPQAFNGTSSIIPPIVIDYDVLYVEALGNTTVRDLAWNFWVNIYTGNDLTVLSSHLFAVRSIIQWAWARQPYKVVWAVCNDGTFLSLTYLKEQEIYGWARHDTNGLVVGIASITEPPVNAIYMIVQRFPAYASSGVYVMERMDNRIWQTIEDHWAVDSAVSNPMTTPTVSCTASASSGAGVTFTASSPGPFNSGMVNSVIRMGGGIATITAYSSALSVTATWNLNGNPGPTGLPYSAAGAWTIAAPVAALHAPHLAGMTVYGLADGVPIGPITVGAFPLGTITLPFPASNVKVGLAFTAQVQTPYLNGQDVLQGTRKAIPAVVIRLAGTADAFQVGRDQPDGAAQNPQQLGPAWTPMETATLTSPTGGQTGPTVYTSPSSQSVTQVFTGDYYIQGAGASWESKGQVAIQQTAAVGFEITAIMPQFVPGDIPEGGHPMPGPQAPRAPNLGNAGQTPEGAYAMMRPPRL